MLGLAGHGRQHILPICIEFGMKRHIMSRVRRYTPRGRIPARIAHRSSNRHSQGASPRPRRSLRRPTSRESGGTPRVALDLLLKATGGPQKSSPLLVEDAAGRPPRLHDVRAEARAGSAQGRGGCRARRMPASWVPPSPCCLAMHAVDPRHSVPAPSRRSSISHSRAPWRPPGPPPRRGRAPAGPPAPGPVRARRTPVPPDRWRGR